MYTYVYVNVNVRLCMIQVYRILSAKKETHPHYVGNSVFSYTQIYKKLIGFIQALHMDDTSGGGGRDRGGRGRGGRERRKRPRLYMACVDVKVRTHSFILFSMCIYLSLSLFSL